jgi:hypothetical protein
MNVLKSLAITATLIVSTISPTLAEDVTASPELVGATKDAYCKMANIALSKEYSHKKLSQNTLKLDSTCADLKIYYGALTVEPYLSPAEAREYMLIINKLYREYSPARLHASPSTSRNHKISDMTRRVFALALKAVQSPYSSNQQN